MGLFGGLNSKSLEFDTTLEVSKIGKVLNDYFGSKKIESINQIEDSGGALSKFSGNKEEIAIVASEARSLFNKSVFCVQVYVSELGDRRHVQLVALGENPLLNRANKDEVISMKKSVNVINEIQSCLV